MDDSADPGVRLNAGREGYPNRPADPVPRRRLAGLGSSRIGGLTMSDQSAASGLGTILGVWAHPDDETWLSAVHMARAVRMGSRVACVTATRGELGSPDPDRWPPGEGLAKIRTAELDAALAILGVSEHYWLDYPDGGCAAVPLDEGAQRVLDMLERVRPNTVLTFGPDGMTGHSDHQTVGGWVTAAVAAWTGPPPQVLWATNTPGWLGRVAPEVGRARRVHGRRTALDAAPRAALARTPVERRA